MKRSGAGGTAYSPPSMDTEASVRKQWTNNNGGLTPSRPRKPCQKQKKMEEEEVEEKEKKEEEGVEGGGG